MNPTSDGTLKVFCEVYSLVAGLPEVDQTRVLESVGALLGYSVQFGETQADDESCDDDD